ncbi:MAG TPA: autotransporter domain-containing protein [Gammaproteobacteria bacterium]|nr:autotransporter domain-containing protein [Gammaproteobacteria bacterium]
MKFEILITFFKNFFIKAIALSLLCIAGQTAAGTYTVTDADGQTSDGTLYWATEKANAAPGSTIEFSPEIPENTQIAPIDGSWTFTQDVTVNTRIPANLSISTNSAFQIGPGAKMTLIGGHNSTNNAVTWDVDIINPTMLTLNQKETSRYTQGISGGGSLTAQIAAGKTLTFSAANTYTGGTNIMSGTLATSINNALAPTGPLYISPGTAFTVGNTYTQTVSRLTGGGILDINGTSFTLNSASNDTFSGVVTGAGNFIKTGDGTETLSGVNTATGTLTINDGVIKISPTGMWSGPVAIDSQPRSTLEMNGGIVLGAISGNSEPEAIVKVTGNFTPATNITNVGSVNVLQGGTLFLTKNIVGGGQNIGNVVNAGTITHTENATRDIAGDFTQQQAGIINIGITNSDPGQYSQFNVARTTTLQGGIMNIVLPDSTVIDGGEVFPNIINNVQPNPILPTVSKPSLFLTFTPTVDGGNNLVLTASREPYKELNEVPALEGVAEALDGLIKNNKFDPVLRIVDGATTQDEYKGMLEELAPNGLNGNLAPGAGAIDQALLRLEADRWGGASGVLARAGNTRTGYAAGDMMENRGSYGPIVFGNSTKQGTSNGLTGYNAVTGGFGFLGDVPIAEYFRVGLGASYANTAVKQSDNTGSNTTIGNTQGLAYGSATYGPLFLDSVLSVGMNNYHEKRNMPSFGQTATSAYNGFQYGAKVKTGFTIQYSQVEYSPMAAVQYMNLNIGRRTVKGAGILNQNVDATKTSTVRVSLGGRIAETSQQEDFFPEVHAFYLVDVKSPQLTVTSRFVAGGGSFVSKAAAPPKAGINVGASLTALVSEDFAISGGYDLEAKKSFRSHSASLKFKFLF